MSATDAFFLGRRGSAGGRALHLRPARRDEDEQENRAKCTAVGFHCGSRSIGTILGDVPARIIPILRNPKLS